MTYPNWAPLSLVGATVDFSEAPSVMAGATAGTLDALKGHHSAWLERLCSLLGQRMHKRSDLQRTAPAAPHVVRLGGGGSSPHWGCSGDHWGCPGTPKEI